MDMCTHTKVHMYPLAHIHMYVGRWMCTLVHISTYVCVCVDWMTDRIVLFGEWRDSSTCAIHRNVWQTLAGVRWLLLRLCKLGFALLCEALDCWVHKLKACTNDQIWSKCVGYWDAPLMKPVLSYLEVTCKIITGKIWGSLQQCWWRF
jgi:hypothetical protein